MTSQFIRLTSGQLLLALSTIMTLVLQRLILRSNSRLNVSIFARRFSMQEILVGNTSTRSITQSSNRDTIIPVLENNSHDVSPFFKLFLSISVTQTCTVKTGTQYSCLKRVTALTRLMFMGSLSTRWAVRSSTHLSNIKKKY